MNLDETATPEEYITARGEDLDAYCKGAKEEVVCFKKIREKGQISQEEFQKATDNLQAALEKNQKELGVIRKSKKHFVQDSNEKLTHSSGLLLHCGRRQSTAPSLTRCILSKSPPKSAPVWRM